MLGKTLTNRGWEVLSYPDPHACPLYAASGCACPPEEVCADVLVTDLDMPHMNGLAFARELLQKGCKIPNLAMFTDSQSPESAKDASALGFVIFEKSNGITPLLLWLSEVESRVLAGRKLAIWSEAEMPPQGIMAPPPQRPDPPGSPGA